MARTLDVDWSFLTAGQNFSCLTSRFHVLHAINTWPFVASMSVDIVARPLAGPVKVRVWPSDELEAIDYLRLSPCLVLVICTCTSNSLSLSWRSQRPEESERDFAVIFKEHMTDVSSRMMGPFLDALFWRIILFKRLRIPDPASAETIEASNSTSSAWRSCSTQPWKSHYVVQCCAREASPSFKMSVVQPFCFVPPVQRKSKTKADPWHGQRSPCLIPFSMETEAKSADVCVFIVPKTMTEQGLDPM